MIIQPGRPFWSGFTAFASSMVALLSMDQFAITDLDVMVNWGGAIVSSLFVAAVVYGKEKITDYRAKNGNGKHRGEAK